MRDIVIIHAPADGRIASALAKAHGEVWLTSALDPMAPQGAFGPKFRLAAIWSQAAEAAGLAAVYAALLAGRDRPTVLLRADATPVPPALVGAAHVTAFAEPAALDAALAAFAQPANGTAPVKPLASPVRMREFGRAIAAAAFSLGFGAILAHAAGLGRVERYSDAEFGFAPRPIESGAEVLAAAPSPTTDAVAARADALFARAHGVAHSAAARSRAEIADAFRAQKD